MPSAKNTSEVMRERVAKVARFSFCQKNKAKPDFYSQLDWSS